MLSGKAKGLIAVGVSVIIIGILYGSGFSCGIEHATIINDSQRYEDLDPESCEELVYRIIELNENCDTDIEILDCG